MTSAAKGGVARGRPDPNLQISPQSLKWELLPINPVPRSIVNNRRNPLNIILLAFIRFSKKRSD